MKTVRIASLAADDLRAARNWYEKRSPGLGRRLVDAVDVVISEISERPRRFPVIHGDVRRALVKPFSYAVFFRDFPDFVRVIAVLHQHRNPSVWRRRR